MSKPPEALLFDLDGTLIDTAPTFVKVLNKQLELHDKAPLAFEKIREQVSHGARALITLAFGLKEGEDNFETLRLELLDLYEANIADGSSLFPGMDEVIEKAESKNIPWGIVTNKPSRFTFLLIEKLCLNKNCAVVVCPDDVTNTKPDAEPLELAAFRLNVNAKNCFYVGDHERDIAAGNAANMLTFAALFGYIEKEDDPQQWKADHSINHAKELLDFL